MTLKEAFFANQFDLGATIGQQGNAKDLVDRMHERITNAEDNSCYYLFKERDFHFNCGLAAGIHPELNKEEENSILKIDKLGGGPIEKSGIYNGVQIDRL